jgi:hypothetical protein
MGSVWNQILLCSGALLVFLRGSVATFNVAVVRWNRSVLHFAANRLKLRKLYSGWLCFRVSRALTGLSKALQAVVVRTRGFFE